MNTTKQFPLVATIRSVAAGVKGAVTATLAAATGAAGEFRQTPGTITASSPIVPVSGVTIQNESTFNLRFQFNVEVYDDTVPAHAIVLAGQTRSFDVLMSTFAMYNAGAGAVRFTPSAPAAHDEDVIVLGWLE